MCRYTFKIYFPRVKAPSEVPAMSAQPLGRLGGSETILLVEDEEMVRDLAQGILERYGYTVLASRNVRDAVRLAEEDARPVHLLLTDTIMPEMNGPEVAERIVSLRPDTKVLYMSGYTDKAFEHVVAKAPGTPFIQKPFTAQTLAQKVREVLTAVPALTAVGREARERPSRQRRRCRPTLGAKRYPHGVTQHHTMVREIFL